MTMNWNSGNIYGMGVMSSIQTDRLAKQGERRRDHPSRNTTQSSSLSSGTVPEPTMKQAEDAVYAILDQEIARRKSAEGDANATTWARTAGAAIGVEVGKLKPEYLKRAAAGGQADADRWIVVRSRAIAARYIDEGRR
ncbi:hypothetical protein [Shinella sp.]|uniref:hypothetical protein n=1 Tax=Shinella sp. TaxID=1870904 RepID=UPI0039E222D4